MGTKADRNKIITRYVDDFLKNQGLILFEKWYSVLQNLNSPQKVHDFEVRDKMLEEILALVAQDNSLILNKKDKGMVEELLNKFLLGSNLLK